MAATAGAGDSVCHPGRRRLRVRRGPGPVRARHPRAPGRNGGERPCRNPRGLVISAWRSFRTLVRNDRALVLEGALLLSFVWIGLRLLSFVQLRSLLARYAVRFRTASAAARPGLDRTTWAVRAVADRSPVSMTCLVRAVAADAILRRHGFASQVRIGVRRHDGAWSRPLDSHAWVECDDRIVLGQLDDLGDYTVMSPSAR